VGSVLPSDSESDSTDLDRDIELRNDHSDPHELRVELPREGDEQAALMMNAYLEAGDDTRRRDVDLGGIGDDPQLRTELDGGTRSTHDIDPGFQELIVSVTENGDVSVETSA